MNLVLAVTGATGAYAAKTFKLAVTPGVEGWERPHNTGFTLSNNQLRPRNDKKRRRDGRNG